MGTVVLNNKMIFQLAKKVAGGIVIETGTTDHKIFGVPRGGIPAAYAVMYALERLDWADCEIVDHPKDATVIVDDIIDSGETRNKYKKDFPDIPFVSLVEKSTDGWVVFPWEGNEEGSAEDIPVRLLQYIGEDVSRQGLQETPKRFLEAWKHWTEGYLLDPKDILKVFEDGAQNVDEMIFIGSIPFTSHCEHHLAPFTGMAHVAYVPNGKLIGLSKIPRLVDIFARRLQVQERMTTQIAETLEALLKPIGVGVVIRAGHSCIDSRGIKVHGTMTTTSKVLGCLKQKPEARAEFLKFVEFEVLKK
jgi:GTP cyclohydrolase I